VEPEDQEGGNQQEVLAPEVLAPEVLEDEEQDVELPECTDHQPSSFEKSKPQSISLPTV